MDRSSGSVSEGRSNRLETVGDIVSDCVQTNEGGEETYPARGVLEVKRTSSTRRKGDGGLIACLPALYCTASSWKQGYHYRIPPGAESRLAVPGRAASPFLQVQSSISDPVIFCLGLFSQHDIPVEGCKYRVRRAHDDENARHPQSGTQPIGAEMPRENRADRSSILCSPSQRVTRAAQASSSLWPISTPPAQESRTSCIRIPSVRYTNM